MVVMTNEAIETSLVKIVDDLVQDWGLDLEDDISGDTLLVNDLDFASVDIIQLCVAIEEYYSRKFGFQDLLMEDGRYVSDLSIAQMTDFIGKKLKDGEI